MYVCEGLSNIEQEGEKKRERKRERMKEDTKKNMNEWSI